MWGIPNNRLAAICFAFVFHFSTSVFAQIKTYVAESSELLMPLIVVTKASETPSQAWQRYLREIQSDSSLFELFQGKIPLLADLKFKALSEADLQNSIVLIANDPQDYTQTSRRLQRFENKISNSKGFGKGTSILLLPVAADVGLTRTEARELREIVRNNVPFLIAMGGADVDPSFYRQQTSYAVNVSARRDQFEIELLRTYLRSGGPAEKPAQGFLLAVCRGAQATAVALGYPLIQDIPKLSAHHQNHQQTDHPIEVLKTTHNLMTEIAQTQSIEVNSYHHQSVRWVPNRELEIAALSHDGVIEALEHKSGRALLLQFHPEMMTKLGQRVFDHSIDKSFAMKTRSCQRVFN